MTIRFVFRPSESASRPKSGVLRCYLTVDKTRRTFTTPVRCQRREWDEKGQRLVGKGQQARLDSAALADITAGINRLYYDLERAGQHVTAERLLKGYLGGGGGRRALLACWQQFLDERQPLVGRDFGPAKWQADERRGRLLKHYLAHAQALDLLPDEFTAKHANNFHQWLRTRCGFSLDYTSKVLQTTQQVLRWCCQQELCAAYPLEGYKLRFSPPKPPVFLTDAELARLQTHRFAAAPLQRAADCFLFQCYTGLAYVDLARFRQSAHTRPGPDGGRLQLFMPRQKTSRSTGLPAVLPLLPAAVALLATYGERLPVPTNQVYNRLLKEVAAVVGLDCARLTSHVGRKTAGALLLRSGMSMAAVSRALGHSSISITQRLYAAITETIVEVEFERVFG